MKKIFRKLHLWLSVPFGLIISIICLTGAILVFETELMELCYHDRYYVEQAGNEPLTPEVLLGKVSATLPDSVSTTGINIPTNPERAWSVGISQPLRASVLIDQYTGEVKGVHKKTPFFSFVIRMHRWLLDGIKPGGGMSVGKTIVGVSTLIFVFILITGIVTWVPRSYKALKKRLKISVDKGWRRFWYDLHLAGGMWMVIVLLALSLTGLTWSFAWYRTGFYKVFGAETPQGHHNRQSKEKKDDKASRQETGKPKREGREGRQEKATLDASNWQAVYDRISKMNPEYKQISISDGSVSVSFTKWGNQRAADRYTFNPQSGEIEEISLYKDQDKSGKVRGWIYSVHVGSWGGWLTKIITFIAALVGAALPITGYYFWIRKAIKKKKRHHSSV